MEASISQAAGPSYTSCDPNSIFVVESLDMVPYPPKKGNEVSLKAVVNSFDEVAGGTVNVEIKRAFVKKSFVFQLCNVLPNGCPVKKGRTEISTSRTLPRYIPSGTYKLDLKVRDHNGQDLMCINAEFELV